MRTMATFTSKQLECTVQRHFLCGGRYAFAVADVIYIEFATPGFGFHGYGSAVGALVHLRTPIDGDPKQSCVPIYDSESVEQLRANVRNQESIL